MSTPADGENLSATRYVTVLVRLAIPARGRVHGEIVDVAGHTEARFVGWRNLLDTLRRVVSGDAVVDDQQA
ncbi:MAG TPA: hypothetical protein VFM49_15135 [Chloroflexia bacterium]|nr:hypothetical protein [Chloroflexia bacterium]